MVGIQLLSRAAAAGPDEARGGLLLVLRLDVKLLARVVACDRAGCSQSRPGNGFLVQDPHLSTSPHIPHSSPDTPQGEGRLRVIRGWHRLYNFRYIIRVAQKVIKMAQVSISFPSLPPPSLFTLQNVRGAIAFIKELQLQTSQYIQRLTTLQKATKTLAASNTSRLNQTFYLTLFFHLLFWLLRGLLFRTTFTRRSLILYLFLSTPQLLIQFLFERQSRPTLTPSGSIQRAGEDLEAKGLTEYMWDVVYWSYGTLFFVAVTGDWAWWLWGVMPVYGLWLAWTTYTGMRGGYTDAAGVPQPEAASKRQAKMEKRGGQKVAYR